jgi:hypothetical protein
MPPASLLTYLTQCKAAAAGRGIYLGDVPVATEIVECVFIPDGPRACC